MMGNSMNLASANLNIKLEYDRFMRQRFDRTN